MKKSEKTERWFRPVLALGAAAVLTVGTGCEETEGPNEADTARASFGLSPATSCEDVRDQVADAYAEQALQAMYRGYYELDGPVAMDDAMGDSAEVGGDGGATEAPSEYTDTNVQEVGVDEPDFVKTDGTHIYAIADNSLQVLKSWPPEETDRLGRLDFPADVNPHSIFLKDDTVAVFSSIWGGDYYDDGGELGVDVVTDEDEGSEGDTPPEPDSSETGEDTGDIGMPPQGDEDVEPDVDPSESYFSGTRITLVDVSDRANPEIIRQLDVEGHYVSARMIGSKAYMVSNSYLQNNLWWYLEEASEIDGLPVRDDDTTPEELEVMREDARPLLQAFFREVLDDSEIEGLLPRRRIVDNDNEVVLSNSMYDCTDLYLPAVTAELGVLNISSFELDDKTSIESTGLLATGWQVYASQQHLYIAMSSRSWWWGWWGGDRENESHIHKFHLDPSTTPQYVASGKVDGWILNQFSFSEHEGYLRVATTDNRWEANPQTGEVEDQGGNHVIVLEEEDGLLVETGSVRDLAPTERIYSARFLGEKGYIVTFRETDPLYTFDLSDPYDPQMMGELKIEGFSSYMHPLDENHLLAIGRDGDENGVMTGVHLQVFDVSDMTEPERIQHHVISTGGWSSDSEAMWNHLAFTYQPRLGVLAVPMNIWENDDQFTGLMLFKATTEEISEIGRIDHGDLASQNWCLQAGEATDCTPADYWQWWSQMRRSIMMSGDDEEEVVYSISSVGLKVNKTFEVDQELASVLWRD